MQIKELEDQIVRFIEGKAIGPYDTVNIKITGNTYKFDFVQFEDLPLSHFLTEKEFENCGIINAKNCITRIINALSKKNLLQMSAAEFYRTYYGYTLYVSRADHPQSECFEKPQKSLLAETGIGVKCSQILGHFFYAKNFDELTSQSILI